MKRATPYADTKVPVDKSRAEIARLLVTSWKVRGLNWEDDFDSGATVLRFRWTPDEASSSPATPIVVRLRLVPVADRIRSRNPKEREQLRERENRRLHRVCYWWIKAMAEAVDAGLLSREAVLLPWVETPKGETVSELLVPRIGLMSSGALALTAPRGGA